MNVTAWTETQREVQGARASGSASAVAAGVARAVEDVATEARPELPETYYVARWYAVHTSANHEKRVAEQFAMRKVEHFLPLYESVRRWKDRRVTLQLPLFPGYVFVRMALGDRLRVQQVPGVARLVGFDGTPAALPEGEVEALRASFESGIRAERHPFLKIGRRVRVKSGPMQGLEGILRRRKGGARLIVSVDLLQQAASVEIGEEDLELL